MVGAFKSANSASNREPRASATTTKSPMSPDQLSDHNHPNLKRAASLVLEAMHEVRIEIDLGDTDMAVAEVLVQLTAVKNRLDAIVESPPQMLALNDVEATAKQILAVLEQHGAFEKVGEQSYKVKITELTESISRLHGISNITPSIRCAIDESDTLSLRRLSILLMKSSWRIYKNIEATARQMPSLSPMLSETRQLWGQVVDFVKFDGIEPIVPALGVKANTIHINEAHISYEKASQPGLHARIIRVENVGVRLANGRTMEPADVIVADKRI